MFLLNTLEANLLDNLLTVWSCDRQSRLSHVQEQLERRQSCSQPSRHARGSPSSIFLDVVAVLTGLGLLARMARGSARLERLNGSVETHPGNTTSARRVPRAASTG
jgi:hypothetical protein